MATQGLTTSTRGAVWPSTLGTFVVSVALGVGMGWTAHTASIASKPTIASAGQLPAVAAASAPSAVGHPGGGHAPVQAVGTLAAPATRTSASGRRLVLLLPGDGASVSSSRIAIAGLAHSRPHGVAIRTVSVELFVGGRRGARLVARTDLQVSSARFAGFLDIPSSLTATTAELRISDLTLQAGPPIVQQLRLDIG
jgi:hypothetical protein